MENWAKIDEFPLYSVSDRGRVRNDETDRMMKIRPNNYGALMVGLMKEGEQHIQSVKILVAEAFVDGETPMFDTPIQKDRNDWNCNADNIAWRPRWFAWEYCYQFTVIGKDEVIWSLGPLIDDEGIIYQTMLDAVIVNGVLVVDVNRSLTTGEKIFPIWKSFGLYRK